LIASDHVIASAITKFSSFVKKIYKPKLQMIKNISSQILESDNKEGR